ncbi:MAG: hypothetical protein ACTSQJ_06550 [Promethearchaeota archaeon]
MKFKNFLLATKVIKYIIDNPRCTVPQIRDSFDIMHSNPPSLEEKDLYKVIRYLERAELIEKINNTKIRPGGAHFFLRVSQNGSRAYLSLKKIFSDVQLDIFKLSSTFGNKNNIRYEDLSTEFSILTKNVLNELIQEFLDELPLDSRRFLRSKRPKLNNILDKSHKKLQEKVSNIIETLT